MELKTIKEFCHKNNLGEGLEYKNGKFQVNIDNELNTIATALTDLNENKANKDDLSTLYKVKGSSTVANINVMTPEVGWVYNLTDSGTIINGLTGEVPVDAGDNVVYTDSGWDKLSAATKIALEAGDNISIEGNVISAIGYKYDKEKESFSIGVNTTASEYSSYAEGNSTTASGSCSHAEGYNTTASEFASHAEGCVTEANNAYEHAQGCYNVSNKNSDNFGDAGNTIHSIGIGSDVTRKNAQEVMQNGDHYIIGIGGYDGTNVTDEEVKTLQKVITDLENVEPATYSAGDNINVSEDNVISALGYKYYPEWHGFQETYYSKNQETAKSLVLCKIRALTEDEKAEYLETFEKSFTHKIYNRTFIPRTKCIISVKNLQNENVDLNIKDTQLVTISFITWCLFNVENNAELLTTSTAEDTEYNITFTPGVYGENSHTEGDLSSAVGNSSHAEGYWTVASGNYSHSEGLYTEADGKAAHAEGNSTITTGNSAHAEGEFSESKATASHAEGRSTIASGKYSHSEGYKTVGEGQASHVEGYESVATGQASHAEGLKCYATGNYSHVEGNATTASGEASHTEGIYTVAYNTSEHAQGCLNVSNNGATADKQTIHSIGIGSNEVRKNAQEVMQNGDFYVIGVGNYNGANIEEEGVKTLQEAINSKVDKEEGKGLSTNDYTTEEKTKLEGIEEGAQVNTVVSVNGQVGEVILEIPSVEGLVTTEELNSAISGLNIPEVNNLVTQEQLQSTLNTKEYSLDFKEDLTTIQEINISNTWKLNQIVGYNVSSINLSIEGQETQSLTLIDNNWTSDSLTTILIYPTNRIVWEIIKADETLPAVLGISKIKQ